MKEPLEACFSSGVASDLSRRGEVAAGSWYLVGRGQACCQMSYNAQDRPPQKESHSPVCQRCWRGETRLEVMGCLWSQPGIPSCRSAVPWLVNGLDECFSNCKSSSQFSGWWPAFLKMEWDGIEEKRMYQSISHIIKVNTISRTFYFSCICLSYYVMHKRGCKMYFFFIHLFIIEYNIYPWKHTNHKCVT